MVDEALLESVRQVALAGGQEAQRHFRRHFIIENKDSAGFDPVTAADRAAETVMRAVIETSHPHHAIVGEEHEAKEGSGPWRWVLDPIDGTRGFLCGTPTWTTLVGLEHDGTPVAGAICQPVLQELWLATSAHTTFHGADGRRSGEVSGLRRLESARLATTDPRVLPEGNFTEAEARAFAELGRRVRVTRFGHDAYAYGLLALGQLDLVVEAGLQHHDVAALVPVVEGAGGLITDWAGHHGRTSGRVIAAASQALLDATVDVLRPYVRP